MSLSLLRISRALARSDEKTFAKLWPKVRHNNMWVTSLWQKIFKEEKVSPGILKHMENSLNIDEFLLNKAKLKRFVFLKDIFPFVSFSYPQTSSRLAFRVTRPLLLDQNFFGSRAYPPLPKLPEDTKANIYDCLSSLLQHHSIPSSLLSQNTNTVYEAEIELLNIAKILSCSDNDLLDIVLPRLALTPQQKSFVLRRQIYLSGENWNILMEETTLEELKGLQNNPLPGFAPLVIVGLSSELQKAKEAGEALKLKQAITSNLAAENSLRGKVRHHRKM